MNIPPKQGSSELTRLHLDTSAIRIRKILVATDFSEPATLAAKVAARLAKQFRCRLDVLHAVAPQLYTSGGPMTSVMLQRADIENARKRLHAYAAKIPQLRVTQHEEIVSPEPVVDAISTQVKQNSTDLVVVGSRGHDGLGKLVLGSAAEAAVRRLHCPVLVVGPHCTTRYGLLKKIVFATSLHAGSLRAAQYAMSIARESGATLTVTHVFTKHIAERDILGEKQDATEMLRQLLPDDSELRKHVRFEVVIGDRAEEIVKIANQNKTGLIVMSARKGGALADHAPWGTLSKVIGNAPCPVLAVQSHLV